MSPSEALLVPLLALWFPLLVIDTLARAALLGRVTAPRTFVADMLSWAVEVGGRQLTFPLRFGVFLGIQALVPWSIPTGALAVAVAFVLIDLTYYWKHRWLHHQPFLWALHQAHHTPREVTISSGVRLGWLERQLDDFFYVWLVLVGFDAWVVILLVEVNHLLQIGCHNEWMGRLPLVEGWLNTPSAHRVHHSADLERTRGNYGGALIVWDRLFGTYREEPAEPYPFGVDIGYVGDNPLKFQLLGLVRWARGRSGGPQ